MDRETVANVPSLITFLGPKAYGLVTSVPDAELRERMVTALTACAEGLTVIDSLDLSPHELSDPETANVSTWEALAPHVAKILVQVRGTGDRLVALFPEGTNDFADDEVSASDLEAAFDLMANAEGSDDGVGSSLTRRDRGLDLVVQTASASNLGQVGDGIRTLVQVLHQDIVLLGQKLRTPQIVGDRWFLLGELHQFLHQCAQCLEAIVATVLGALTDEQLDDVLPRYTNATGRAVKLRTASTRLGYQVEELNQAIGRAPIEDIPILILALEEALNAFSLQPTYKYLRPLDKRPIISFRVYLSTWQKRRQTLDEVRHQVEGFSKFLALMGDLNWREQLAHHDALHLANARTVLESEMDLELALPYLRKVYGRSPAIDRELHAIDHQRQPDRRALTLAVQEAEARLGPH